MPVAQPDPADVAGLAVHLGLQVEAAEDQPLVGSVELRDPPRGLVDHGVPLDQAALVAQPAAVVSLLGQLLGSPRRLLQLEVDPVHERLLASNLLLGRILLCPILGRIPLDQLVSQ